MRHRIKPLPVAFSSPSRSFWFAAPRLLAQPSNTVVCCDTGWQRLCVAVRVYHPESVVLRSPSPLGRGRQQPLGGSSRTTKSEPTWRGATGRIWHFPGPRRAEQRDLQPRTMEGARSHGWRLSGQPWCHKKTKETRQSFNLRTMKTRMFRLCTYLSQLKK